MSETATQRLSPSTRKRLAAVCGSAAAAIVLTGTIAPVAQAEAQPAAAPSAAAQAGGDLNDWINKALKIMDKHDIPGSYEGIHRNIMRESSGDPNAINNWDVNADNGVPSQGLLQVIPPTFDAYHVKGTPDKITHPVSNIVAACNYAADRYGSIDNVWGAY